MALSTSTSTANPELDSMCFKSTSIKEAELFAVQQAQINYICANLANNSMLNYNIYKTPEYLEFYERRISPNQVNKIAYDLTRTGVASANETRQLCADLTGTKNRQKHIKKKSQNCVCIPVEDSSGIKIRWVTLSKQKPAKQSNKKKSTAIVELAVLIFLLLCLNGAFFWSFIFGLLMH